MYWRLQQARSCWFLHCANAGTAKKLAKKRERSQEIFPFMTCLPPRRDTVVLWQGQRRECPSGSKRVVHRLQLRTSYPAVANRQMGLPPCRLPIPYNRNRAPARTRSHPSFDLLNALRNNPALRELLRGYLKQFIFDRGGLVLHLCAATKSWPELTELVFAPYSQILLLTT